MKAIVKCEKCKILDVSKNENQNGNETITWYTCIFMQDTNVNTLTCDKQIAPVLKPGSTYDLIITCQESPKSFRNGVGAYIENKFKITSFVGFEKK